MARTSAGLSSGDVREHNLGLVLTELSRAGRASRSELSRRTGLAASAITLLVSELMTHDLVKAGESSPPRPSAHIRRAGRPQEGLVLDGARSGLVAVQFALDEVVVAAVDLAGRSLVREVRPVVTAKTDPEAIATLLASIVASVDATLRRASVRMLGVTVVAPAPVTLPEGKVFAAVDFGWGEVDLARSMGEHMAAPPLGVRVVNDANAAAFMEFSELQADSSSPPIEDVVYVKSDTGIGGGAIVGGKVLTGASGIAFEPGHMIVQPGGSPCVCGRKGCLVTVAGPEVVVAAAGLEGYRRGHGLPRALDELLSRDAEHDADARNALDAAASWLTIALDNCTVLLQPRAIVLGGYLAAIAPRVRSIGVAGIAGEDILPASHGQYSGVDGALALERLGLLRHPGVLVRPTG